MFGAGITSPSVESISKTNWTGWQTPSQNGQFVFNGSLTGSPLSDFLLGRIFTVGKGALSQSCPTKTL
jgi:hypothetical protein